MVPLTMMSFKNPSDTFFLVAVGAPLRKCALEWLTKERNGFYNHKISGNQDLFPSATKKWKIVLSTSLVSGFIPGVYICSFSQDHTLNLFYILCGL